MFTQIFFVLVALVIGSYTDLKRHEVPDWVNFCLIFLGVGVGAVVSAVQWSLIPLLSSLVGLLLGFLIGWVMYYTGQWGGGDSKMIMGIGAMLGIHPFLLWQHAFDVYMVFMHSIFLQFLFATIVVGAFYGILWSAGLAVMHKKAFLSAFMEQMRNKKIVMGKYAVFIAVIALLLIAFLFRGQRLVMLLYLLLAVIVYVSFYLFNAIKVVERVCMIKDVPPSQLTEGDWIAKDVVVGKKKIVGPKDLGVSFEQIAELKRLHKAGKIKKISVKYGIPFVPSFFIAFVLVLVLQSLL